MEREPFIRAIEVWVPSQDGRTIDLVSGVYGAMDYFASASRGMRLGKGEGLPGKTWQHGRPMVLGDFGKSYFVRKEAALVEELSCAVSLPCWRESRVAAVLLLFCGDERFRLGALELWQCTRDSQVLALADGYFGQAHGFEAEARSLHFARGQGIPGKVWESGAPVFFTSLRPEGRFLRHEAEDRIGFDRAFGVPCRGQDGSAWVLTLVSSRLSPVVGRIEYWVFDPERGAFRFEAGYCEVVEDLAGLHADVWISGDTGLFGRACRKGIPLVDEDLATDIESPTACLAVAAGLKSMVVVPMQGKMEADSVLVWYF
ncbi:hypothetical protein HT136_01070 [Novosphingobium profundi]|uniref:hypothetical protein n=1 Tax=Novosphingobium profundi TaxID=1774954 RepID=UPI001BDB2C61|nr:hypothetical protein [Novosphingobium profundi]MBT0666958.1 hypothetical protein [Novosphingobium profundi]